MKTAKVFLIIGFVLVAAAIIFIAIAFRHPEMSFSWSNTATNAVYVIYFIVTVLMFLIYALLKK